MTIRELNDKKPVMWILCIKNIEITFVCIFLNIFYFFFVFFVFLSFLSSLPFCLFVFLSFCTVQYSTIQYSMVQYSTVTGEEDGVRGWLTPYSTPRVVSVWQVAASLVAECGTNILFKKLQKSLFKKTLFGALPKISDWIWKYVQICHGFPFIKWCDTWQSAQQFGC